MLALAGCSANTESTYGDGSRRSKLAPVAEAQRLQGKDARKDRRELKALMSNGNAGPVDPVITPWCAGFMNAVLSNTGWETTGSLRARSFLHYGLKTSNPDHGDIVVLRRGHDNWSGHVGFFMGYEYYDGTKYVKVLGGNTEKKVDVGYFPVNRVLGFRSLTETPYTEKLTPTKTTSQTQLAKLKQNKFEQKNVQELVAYNNRFQSDW
jgi:uncharacterized protein (TIGR02594 family)